MAECHYCHTPVENSHKYCRSCGANLMLPEFDRAFCPYCGSRVGSRQWFCQACKKPLDKEAEGSIPIPATHTTPEKIRTRSNARIIGVLSGVGLVILALAWALIWRTPHARLPVQPLDIVEGKASIAPNQPRPTPTTAVPLPQTSVPASPAKPGTNELLREQLTDVLSNLQEAQLKKDISRYMQSYVSNFPKLEQKRQKTLAIWKTYDYKLLRYNLKDIVLLDNDAAVAQVSWDIEVHNKVNQKTVTSTQVYKVWFAPEAGGWRVKKLAAISKP